MPSETLLALVLRTTDWSDSSRIVTLWTRELGKVRGLAKGAKRPRSAFESALDLLTVCRISLLRKTSGGLDLVTEARVEHRYPGLTANLRALYSGYSVAELLADMTQEHDPHAEVFDEAVAALGDLAGPACGPGDRGLTDGRRARFEVVLLRELGYSPRLEDCAGCHGPVTGVGLAFAASAGGMVCSACQSRFRDRRPVSREAWGALAALGADPEAWRAWGDGRVEGRVGDEVGRVLGGYVSYLLGRRPRLLSYLEGGREP